MIRKGTVNVLASVFFLVLGLLGIYYLWSSFFVVSVDELMYQGDGYDTVEVGELSQMYSDLFDERTNQAGIPIPAPSDKMGNPNPFSINN